MTDIKAGAKPHLEAAGRTTDALIEYAETYYVGPTWFRTQLKLLKDQLDTAYKADSKKKK